MSSSKQGELFPKVTFEQQSLAEDQIINEHKLVDYTLWEYPIETIVQKYNIDRQKDQNEIFIPAYQRKFVWTLVQQAKFIESVMIGLPIPFIFAADNEGRLEIVDGTQRIRTLEAFLNNKLVLQGLKKLTKLNGFRFKDLILSRQRRFQRKTIRIIELTEKADWEVRKDMFERINTTSTLLSDMEIRKGVFEGEFNKFIRECALNPKFHILCPVSKKRVDRDEREEMILRFFAYSDNYKNFIHSVKEFLDEYMNKYKENFDITRMSLEFENMLDFVDKNFPLGFRKSLNSKSTPRVRFEAIAVGVNLALRESPMLVPKSVSSWLNSAEFNNHTKSDSANSKKKVIGRIEYVKENLLRK